MLKWVTRGGRRFGSEGFGEVSHHEKLCDYSPDVSGICLCPSSPLAPLGLRLSLGMDPQTLILSRKHFSSLLLGIYPGKQALPCCCLHCPTCSGRGSSVYWSHCGQLCGCVLLNTYRLHVCLLCISDFPCVWDLTYIAFSIRIIPKPVDTDRGAPLVP